MSTDSHGRGVALRVKKLRCARASLLTLNELLALAGEGVMHLFFLILDGAQRWP